MLNSHIWQYLETKTEILSTCCRVQISELTQNLLGDDAEVMICAHKLGDDFFEKFQQRLETEMTGLWDCRLNGGDHRSNSKIKTIPQLFAFIALDSAYLFSYFYAASIKKNNNWCTGSLMKQDKKTNG